MKLLTNPAWTEPFGGRPGGGVSDGGRERLCASSPRAVDREPGFAPCPCGTVLLRHLSRSRTRPPCMRRIITVQVCTKQLRVACVQPCLCMQHFRVAKSLCTCAKSCTAASAGVCERGAVHEAGLVARARVHRTSPCTPPTARVRSSLHCLLIHDGLAVVAHTHITPPRRDPNLAKGQGVRQAGGAWEVLQGWGCA